MDSKKTQKVVVIILVVTALLGIVGAFLVYHLSTQDETTRPDTEERQYCACVTAYTTADCNDCSCTRIESQALESKIGEIVDGVCTLDCEETIVEEEQEDPKTIECLIPQVRESNCHSVSIRDPNTRDLIIPPIPNDRPVLITANFVPRQIGGKEENFIEYIFIVNGVTNEVTADEVPSTMIDDQRTYMPEIEFNNFQEVDTLTIQALAHSDRDPDGDSPNRYCYRQYDLTSARSPFCSNLTAHVQPGSTPNTVVINRLELNTPNLTQENEISVEFRFNHENLENVKTQTIPQELLEEIMVNETIFLEHTHLYSTPTLYQQGEGFPTLNSEILDTESISISAQIYADGSAVDSNLCRENISLITTEDVEPEEPEPEEPVTEEPEPEEPEEEIEPEIIIEVAMEGPSCVRKAGDEESESRTNYRIIVTNNSEEEEEITNITNKLPLGFRYVEGTTTINNTLVSDDLLDITAIGESQELIWSDNWVVDSESSLILEYGVNVTHNAIDGENQNEVVVTPVRAPEDMSSLRAEIITLVDDECEHEEELPETGNLTYISFLVGTAALIFGILVYQGKIDAVDKTMLKLISTKAIKKRMMTPQEYLEDSILEEDEKED